LGLKPVSQGSTQSYTKTVNDNTNISPTLQIGSLSYES